MSDKMQTQLSLAAAMRAPRRPVTRSAPRAGLVKTAAPVTPAQVEETITAPVTFLEETQPELVSIEAATAWVQKLSDTVQRQVREAVTVQIETLAREAKTAERAQIKLDDSLSRAINASPETVAMLEGENKRHLSEIQSLQTELERTRRALRVVTGHGMKGFWKRLGTEFSDLSDSARDLIDAAPRLNHGEVTPEVGRRIMAFTRVVAEVVGDYADNCTAYAEDDSES